jgi:hypothetical protein
MALEAAPKVQDHLTCEFGWASRGSNPLDGIQWQYSVFFSFFCSKPGLALVYYNLPSTDSNMSLWAVVATSQNCGGSKELMGGDGGLIAPDGILGHSINFSPSIIEILRARDAQWN